MLYKIGRVLVGLFQKIVYRVHVYGKEKLPSDKTFMLCSNHISNHDPPILGVNMPFKVHYMGKAELFKNPILSKVFRALGAFPVKRGGNGDSAAVRTAVGLLKSGEIVAIFPEGMRAKDRNLRRGKTGAAKIAHLAGVGIVPVGISGRYSFFHRLNIRIGDFIDLREYLGEKPTQEDFQRFTDEVLMRRIGELINAD